MPMGDSIAIVRKNCHRHLDGSLFDAQAGISHLQRIPSAAAWNTVPQLPEHCCVMWFSGLSVMIRRCENHMVISWRYVACLSSFGHIALNWLWTLWKNSLKASPCCVTVCCHVVHADQGQVNVLLCKSSDMLQTVWTYHHEIFIYLDH
jgi:hypothetical protein